MYSSGTSEIFLRSFLGIPLAFQVFLRYSLGIPRVLLGDILRSSISVPEMFQVLPLYGPCVVFVCPLH